MAEGRLAHQIVVRVPQDLHDALQADADDNGRTLAQTVRYHLRRYFAAHPPDQQEPPD